MAKQSWINKVRGWMKSQGFVPVYPEGKKVQRNGTCPNCGNKSAPVFRSEKKVGVYALACIRCKKRSIRLAEGQGAVVVGNAPPAPRTVTESTVPTNPVTAAAKGMVMGSKRLRCKGVTAKGKQCAVMAGPSGYCRHHEDQATNKPTNPGF